MTLWGWHCSHEQRSPRQLLDEVVAAERAGFGASMCSDHFHPWLPQGAQSGHAWTWLGAASQRTGLSLGTVSAPGQRQHPAVVAQAIATLAVLAPRRVWVALGSGEALNERIAGPWPTKPERTERLEACVDVIRRLLAGERVTTREGGLHVTDAQLATVPDHAVPLFGAALSPATAAWCATWADGLITAGTDPDDLRAIVSAFRDAGGAGKPLYLQAQHCWASTDEEARRQAHARWRQAVLPREKLADLASPSAFEEATREVTVAQVAGRVRCSADVSQHAEWLAEYPSLGFDGVFVHQVGEDALGFLDALARHGLPQHEA